MSALTDLFTALANKIRSKTGTATTYTPLEMVSDGIDDVYAAGYDAGGGGATGTPITPSNSSPASMTSGTTYEAQANGYAIASYSSATPSNANPFFMQEDEYYKLSPGWAGGYLIGTYDQITPSDSSPVSLSSGFIYKMGGAGKAVASVTDITPSDSTPAALSSGTVYKAGGAGYAIASNPTTLTPNNTSPPSIASGTIYRGGGTGKAIASIATNGNGVTPSSSGQYFYSGWNRMTAAGYAYSSQPSTGYTNGWNSETTLWTNSAPTSTFAAQTVTLSSSLANYNYVKITVAIDTSTTSTKLIDYIWPRSQFTTFTSTNNNPQGVIAARTTTNRARLIQCTSNTQVTFGAASGVGATGTGNATVIPLYIKGLK